MACKCTRINEDGRYDCLGTGDECEFLIPDSAACDGAYGEGTDAEENGELVYSLGTEL